MFYTQSIPRNTLWEILSYSSLPQSGYTDHHPKSPRPPKWCPAKPLLLSRGLLTSWPTARWTPFTSSPRAGPSAENIWASLERELREPQQPAVLTWKYCDYTMGTPSIHWEGCFSSSWGEMLFELSFPTCTFQFWRVFVVIVLLWRYLKAQLSVSGTLLQASVG